MQGSLHLNEVCDGSSEWHYTERSARAASVMRVGSSLCKDTRDRKATAFRKAEDSHLVQRIDSAASLY